jgi:hypothetical protein
MIRTTNRHRYWWHAGMILLCLMTCGWYVPRYLRACVSARANFATLPAPAYGGPQWPYAAPPVYAYPPAPYGPYGQAQPLPQGYAGQAPYGYPQGHAAPAVPLTMRWSRDAR